MRQPRRTVLAVFSIVLMLTSSACEAVNSILPQSTPQPTQQPAADRSVGVAGARTAPGSSSAAAPLDTIAVAEKVRPATVMIQNVAQVPRELLPILGAGEVPRGVGTGFIYDASGYIATNNHVVEGAQRLKVVLPPPDNRTFDARLVGTDPNTDLAVVKIEATNLPTIPLGSSANLRIGEGVVAVGNALGLAGGPTVTSGVVSALGREVEASGEDPRAASTTLYGLIQTDAAINRGNSGGPLVNGTGEVVGVNTLGALDAQTIGFAIAIDPAKPILDQLQKTGKVNRGYLGISVVSASPAMAALVDANQKPGVVVNQVSPNSPAAAAGFQQGDTITQIGDTAVKDRGDLESALATKYAPGQTVPVKVSRGGNERTLNLTLGERPPARTTPSARG